ncbi:membrane fusion protein, multidrug efflux system [Ekhidna lutea]|uniref:Membrane fusion protein, multidrug efflux system n=1 Tax=Ekhidna lutea TaxID=447679 RepID=A0A239KII1_EKHLU|nr:efflux RND transporter periplasmic adaptor subunit [Ekhidna lutea]SNT18166.1 membrane fusion protein, multidrug efflux system [Ekhidna lutea]
MKNSRTKIYLNLLFAVIVIAIQSCSSASAEVSNNIAEPFKLPVDVKVVSATSIDQIEVVSGSAISNREIAVVSEVSRKIVNVGFTDGSYVTKGQLLYKLDDADLMARLKQVDADLQLATINKNRISALLKNDAVSQEEFDIANARLISLQASKDLLQVEIQKTQITAPFSGIAGITRAFTGSLANPGMTLVKLHEVNPLKIEFSVPEKYSSAVKTSMKISFSLPNVDEQFDAKITAIESEINTQTRALTVHATTDNKDGQLKPGMSARVYYSTSSSNNLGIKIPTEALIPGAGGYSVFVVKGGVAKSTSVKLSNRSESEALISEGLVDGDTVMISNLLRTGEGTPVQIVTSK